jgi:hypothetical protein
MTIFTGAQSFTLPHNYRLSSLRYVERELPSEFPNEDESEYLMLNGWRPDETKFCWGLPGNIEPMNDFDPFGFSKGRSLNEVRHSNCDEALSYDGVAVLTLQPFRSSAFVRLK